MKKSIVVTVLVLVLSLVMSACGSAPQNGNEPQKKGKISLGPDFTKGSKYWPSGKICASAGENASEESIDQDLDYTTQEARKELARQMGVVVNAVYKDYNRKLTAKGGKSDEGAKVDVSIQRVSDMMVSGSDRYDADTTDSMVWVLVCFDKDKFRDAIKNSKDLSEELKEEIMERATNEWDELLKK